MWQGRYKRLLRTRPIGFVRLLRVAASVVVVCTSALVPTVAMGFGYPTATAVISYTNPSKFGQPVTFFAEVRSFAGAPTPTGTVTFTEGTTVLGTASLDSIGRAVFTTSSLTVGSHSITANYFEQPGFNGSGATLTQNVTSTTTATTTTLASAPNPSSLDQPVTFTATVSGSGGTPTGTIVFTEGATTLGTASLDNSGRATFTTSSLTVGTHTISASYGGDSIFSGSSGTLTQNVNPKRETKTMLVSSKNPSKFRERVVFIASVTPISGSGTPTGNVTFKDRASVLATAPLNSSGRSEFITPKLAVGKHVITATYEGDANFASSPSKELVQTVNR